MSFGSSGERGASRSTRFRRLFGPRPLYAQKVIVTLFTFAAHTLNSAFSNAGDNVCMGVKARMALAEAQTAYAEAQRAIERCRHARVELQRQRKELARVIAQARIAHRMTRLRLDRACG